MLIRRTCASAFWLGVLVLFAEGCRPDSTARTEVDAASEPDTAVKQDAARDIGNLIDAPMDQTADQSAVEAPRSDGPVDRGADTKSDASVDTPPPFGYFYVSPSGDDVLNDGRSLAKPFKTLQWAIVNAKPGETIRLSEGTHVGSVTTATHATATAPITITGPATAIVKGNTRNRVFQINHDHIVLDGFTVEGMNGTDPALSASYSDVLVYVAGVPVTRGVTGVKLLRLTMRNARSECIRMRDNATKGEIAFLKIDKCGLDDYVFMGGNTNGEGIFLGSAYDPLFPTTMDKSTGNWIHDNTINTEGNECVEIREFSGETLVERNDCKGQKTATGAAIAVRSSKNVIRSNEIHDNVAVGLRIGNKDLGFPPSEGIDNDFYENNIYNNVEGGILVDKAPQGKVCGNKFANNTRGDLRGAATEGLTPAAPCTPAPDGGTSD